MMRKWSLLLSLLVISAVLAGCSSSAGPEQVIDIDVVNWKFAVNQITVEKGRPVKIILNNKDKDLHDFVIDKIPVSGVKAQDGGEHAHGSGSASGAVHVGAQGGTTATLQFTPKSAGTYTYYCSVPGHKDAGMVGTLVVN